LLRSLIFYIIIFVWISCQPTAEQSIDLPVSPLSVSPTFDEHSNRKERAPYHLSSWYSLDESLTSISNTMPTVSAPAEQWQSWIKIFTTHFQSLKLTKKNDNLVHLTHEHLFCHSNSDGTYLMHQGNQSPYLKFPPTLDNSDHLALFIFDLDALNTQQNRLNTTVPDHAHTPFLLWGVDHLDRSLSHLPHGFGGSQLSLKGKARRHIYAGQSLLNDYTNWFYSAPLKGLYYGYDGPCITTADPIRTHRIFALLFALPSPSRLSQGADINPNGTEDSWRIIAKIFHLSQVPSIGSIKWSGGLLLTPKYGDIHQIIQPTLPSLLNSDL
jgi:hypothetical protein